MAPVEEKGRGAELVLLGRRACHLCGEMVETLEAVAPAYDLTWRTVDVDSDPELRRRYGESVPVLLLGERELARVRTTRRRLRARIERALQASSGSPS